MRNRGDHSIKRGEYPIKSPYKPPVKVIQESRSENKYPKVGRGDHPRLSETDREMSEVKRKSVKEAKTSKEKIPLIEWKGGAHPHLSENTKENIEKVTVTKKILKIETGRILKSEKPKKRPVTVTSGGKLREKQKQWLKNWLKPDTTSEETIRNQSQALKDRGDHSLKRGHGARKILETEITTTKVTEKLARTFGETVEMRKELLKSNKSLLEKSEKQKIVVDKVREIEKSTEIDRSRKERGWGGVRKT